MSYTYATIDGQRVQTSVATAYAGLAAAFKNAFGLDLKIASATRTYEEQKALFLARYRPQATGTGPYNDVRSWNGTRYVRTSSAGTVAVPGTSNHEEDGPIGPRAIDIHDTGADAGVTSRGSKRDVWMASNAGKYGFNNAGYSFGEPWHKEFTGNLVNGPQPADVSSTQRVVGSSPSNGRGDPSTAKPPVGDQLTSGTVGNFDGWIHGQAVEGNDVWFRGTSGRWFWSGGFTDKGTHDLADLNAPVVNAKQRVVGPNGANGRSAPAASAALKQSLAPGTVGNFTGWASAESVQGNAVWFQGTSGDWFWSGGFTSQAVDGLTQVEPPQPPTTPNVLDPAAPWKSQPVDSPLATWVGSPNYDYHDSVMPKTHITLHWMTSLLSATDAQFQNPGTVIQNGRGTGSSANYGVGEDAIHQYVKEDRYVQSDGNAASNATTISVEHEGGWLLPGGTRTAPSKGVLDRGAQLLADIAKRQGWTELTWMVNVFPHKHFVATECPGTLDYAYEIAEANKILKGDSPVDPPVVVPPEVDTITVSKAGLLAVQVALDKLISEGK